MRRRAFGESGSTPLTHHTHTWVSSTITKDPPVIYTHRFGRAFVFQHAAPEALQPRLRILRVGDDFQRWFSPIGDDQGFPGFFYLPEVLKGSGFKLGFGNGSFHALSPSRQPYTTTIVMLP